MTGKKFRLEKTIVFSVFEQRIYAPKSSQYDKALAQKDSLTIWISTQVIAQWLHTGQKGRGRPFVYSDAAIEAVHIIKQVFHLPNRQAEGFVRSLFEKLGIPLPVPDHTTPSRRARKLNVSLPKKAKEPLQVVMSQFENFLSIVTQRFDKTVWKQRQE